MVHASTGTHKPAATEEMRHCSRRKLLAVHDGRGRAAKPLYLRALGPDVFTDAADSASGAAPVRSGGVLVCDLVCDVDGNHLAHEHLGEILRKGT
jgi:hypothetical protein